MLANAFFITTKRSQFKAVSWAIGQCWLSATFWEITICENHQLMSVIALVHRITKMKVRFILPLLPV